MERKNKAKPQVRERAEIERELVKKSIYSLWQSIVDDWPPHYPSGTLKLWRDEDREE